MTLNEMIKRTRWEKGIPGYVEYDGSFKVFTDEQLQAATKELDRQHNDPDIMKDMTIGDIYHWALVEDGKDNISKLGHVSVEISTKFIMYIYRMQKLNKEKK